MRYIGPIELIILCIIVTLIVVFACLYYKNKKKIKTNIETKQCSYCGTLLSKDTLFCSSCGQEFGRGNLTQEKEIPVIKTTIQDRVILAFVFVLFPIFCFSMVAIKSSGIHNNFQNEYYRISFPSDIEKRVSFETGTSPFILNVKDKQSGSIIAVLFPEDSYTPSNYVVALYSLGRTVSINGKTRTMCIAFTYLDSSRNVITSSVYKSSRYHNPTLSSVLFLNLTPKDFISYIGIAGTFGYGGCSPYSLSSLGTSSNNSSSGGLGGSGSSGSSGSSGTTKGLGGLTGTTTGVIILPYSGEGSSSQSEDSNKSSSSGSDKSGTSGKSSSSSRENSSNNNSSKSDATKDTSEESNNNSSSSNNEEQKDNESIEEKTDEGWQLDDTGWRYYKNGGYYAGWHEIDDEYGDHWYYFKDDAYMEAYTWKWSDETHAYYWLCSTGPMIIRLWQWIDNAWYKFDDEGKMQTGWYWDNYLQHWYYFYDNGKLALNTVVEGKQINEHGEMI